MIDVDLPSLQLIKMGEWTFRGNGDDDSCSLTMRSIIDLILYYKM